MFSLSDEFYFNDIYIYIYIYIYISHVYKVVHLVIITLFTISPAQHFSLLNMIHAVFGFSFSIARKKSSSWNLLSSDFFVFSNQLKELIKSVNLPNVWVDTVIDAYQ